MRSKKGVSLVESLMAVAMLGILVLLLANLPSAMGLISKSKNISLAREIAVKEIEDKRSLSYINLANDTSAITDSRINLLPHGLGTVVVEDCNPEICTNDEPIKEVKVTVSWKESNKDQMITLNTFIADGGLNQ